MSRLSLAGLLLASGLAHFIVPGPYRRIVPRVLGHAPLLVAASGVAELMAAALIAVPRTRRVGAGLAFVILLVVWPANLQMALDAGLPGSRFPGASAVLTWLRVPLQIPLLIWAWRLARPGAVAR